MIRPTLLAALALAAAAPVPASLSAGAATLNAHTSLPADITKGPDSLALLGQSTWVSPGQSDFRMDLGITASDAATETVAVDVYPRLITRSDFQAVLGGNFSYAPSPYYQSSVSLDQLPSGPGGGAELDVPVNYVSLTGVYPVQVFLQKEGLTQGKPLTTFLVYAASGASSMQHLGVAVVVPFRADVPVSASGVLGPVPSASASGLEDDAADVATSHAAVTLDASASTLEALARGGSEEKSVVAELARSVAVGDELLPSTSLPVNLGALVSSGLTGELDQQVYSGDSELASLLGEAPDPSTWALPGKASGPVLQALSSLGASEVAVPEAALSTLPSDLQSLTFAQPSKLEASGTELEAIGADSELSQRIGEASAPGQAILVANQVLAELSMIDLEVPNDRRGVVLLPAATASMIDPTFLSVLLTGLDDNPLLRAETLAQEFTSVPPATTSGTQLLVRRLEGTEVARPLSGAGQLGAAQAAVADAASVYGAGTGFVESLDHELFVSTSSVWDSGQRAKIIAGVSSSAQSELGKLRLPPPLSITLTSRHGNLPLTVLSDAGMRARVRLVLSSEELSFVSVKFPSGRCVPVNAGSEQCRLDLVHTTTLQVPVAVRTPGAFQILLEIETPNGTVVASGRDTIRSTAVSEVGLLLMVGAALFLAVWWARNFRHGRRARRLVPAPDGDDTTMIGLGPEGVPDQPGAPRAWAGQSRSGQSRSGQSRGGQSWGGRPQD